jgi:Flp pilus assembly protein TadG
MERDILRNRSGATAIEFALIMPALFLFLAGGIELTTTMWSWNSLENVAKVVARCAAISSPKCATVTTGCASTDASICYAIDVAETYGFSDFEASYVSVNYANVVNGTNFTTVELTYPTSFLGYSLELNATASFPNN